MTDEIIAPETKLKRGRKVRAVLITDDGAFATLKGKPVTDDQISDDAVYYVKAYVHA